jgi:1-acyl-sn-glycerol-3-phosphate acyltransferase
MKILRRIYSTYSLLLFGVTFLLLLPFFLLLVAFKPLRKYLHYLHWVWSVVFLGLSFVPFRLKYLGERPKGPAVICANHFSILDIAVLGFLPLNFIFVGKSELAKIPLFGFIYRKLHITVNRSSLKDRYKALQKAMAAVDNGNSLVMFPEGGVLSEEPPRMARFKEGPFRVAIEKQIPVIPVTIPYNWLILPDDGSYLLYPQTAYVIVHEAIPTTGMRMEDLPALKEQVYTLIDRELKKYNQYEDRQGDFAENRAPGAARL